MTRRRALLLLCITAVMAGLHLHRTVAAPISLDQLAAATLAAEDLPGYSLVRENQVESNNDAFDIGYHRLFSAAEPAAVGIASVDVSVQLLASQVPGQLVALYVRDGRLTQGFSKQPGFQRTGSLGVGNVDDSASFTFTPPNSSAQLAVYLEVFQRGRFVVLIRYAALLGRGDPSALAGFAAAQDGKLQSAAGLPAALLNPLATPSQIPSHRWYTSQDPTATLYYCDDDPSWRGLPVDSLDSFGTAAELLAQYPGRTLNRPCQDGATGP